MDPLSDLELLESVHHFPGPYTFKAIGLADDNFIGRVVGAVRGEVGAHIEPPFSFRRTAAGRHVCVTIEPPVTDASQVLDIYRQLQQVEGLVMLL